MPSNIFYNPKLRKKTLIVNFNPACFTAYSLASKNGCRAPFWRQINGDISYITVKPYDSDVMHITASTYGYFVNGVSTE